MGFPIFKSHFVCQSIKTHGFSRWKLRNPHSTTQTGQEEVTHMHWDDAKRRLFTSSKESGFFHGKMVYPLVISHAAIETCHL